MFFLLVTTVALSAFLTYGISRPGSRLAVADLPNARSLHARSIPRGGGIAILSSVYLVCVFALLAGFPASAEILWLIGGSLMIGIVSYLDDCREVPARYRLAVHGAAAGLLLYAGFCPPGPPFAAASSGWPPLAIAAAVASLLYIVWMINLYNFMDGMDGFAGGMTMIGFAFLAYFGWLQEAWPFFALALSIAAASLGFLLFNFPPARVFMGDVGSAPLGYLTAGLALWGVRDGIFPFWVPVLLFSPFIVDATVTLLLRLLAGEKIWQAHCSHYYQRLVRLGWGHKKTVLAEYLLMLAAGFSAIHLNRHDKKISVAVGLAVWLLIYLLLALTIHALERKTKR